MPRRVRLLLLLLLCLAPAALAQQASLAVGADSVRVGRPVRLTLTVEAQGTVLPLDSAFAGPDVAVVSGPDVQTDLDGQGRLTTRLVYDVAVFALDTLQLPAVPVQVVNSVDTLLLTTAPLRVRVERLVPADSTAALRPAHPPEPFGPPLWAWVLLAATLAALAWWFWRRRPRRAAAPVAAPAEPTRTPLEALLAALDALDRHPPAPGEDARPYFDTLTDSFRTYLDARLNVPAHDQTSRELVDRFDRLERAGTLQAGAAALARELFRVSDLARFADVRPSAQAARLAAEQARTLARYVEQSRAERAHVKRGAPPSLAQQRRRASSAP